MAKVLVETRIVTRADRKRLAVADKPYWRGIDHDVHLGYRKGKRGGVWVVRWRDDGYRQETIGTADDELAVGTLDFDSAVRLARKVVEAKRRDVLAASEGTPLTVGSAVDAYIAMRDKRESERQGRPVRSGAAGKLELYVIGRPSRGNRRAVEPSQLAAVPLHQLSEDDLEAWRESLPTLLKWTSVRRLTNDLKAALNDVHAANRSRLPSTFSETVKHGLRDKSAKLVVRDSSARDNQIRTDTEIADLVAAAHTIDAQGEWDGDLYRLVLVLAATGARFSQVSRLKVGDVQLDASRLLVPVSHKGRGGKSGHTPVPVGPDVMKALAPVIEGRKANHTLLERWRSKQVPGGIKWERVDRGSWKTPAELTRPWALIRSLAGIPDVIPYALRHSSIVRGIRANLPPQLVAKLHDTSLDVIERHYGRYLVHGLDELAARAVVPLVRPAMELEAAD